MHTMHEYVVDIAVIPVGLQYRRRTVRQAREAGDVEDEVERDQER